MTAGVRDRRPNRSAPSPPERDATFLYMSDTVGTAELRQNLSKFLRRVERGERLIVTERNRPVATLSPIRDQPGLARLIAEGLVTPPERPLKIRPVKLSDKTALSRSLDEVRGERGF